MKRLKSILLFIWLILSVLTINAQLCDIMPNKVKGCSGDLFEFSILAPPSSYYSIMWNFGDGDSSNQKTSTVLHMFDTFGVFTVKVTLFSDAGGTIKCGPRSITIHVYDPPNAIIGLLSPTKQCFKRNSFQFIDNSVPGKSHAPIVYQRWDFGDGGQSDTADPLYSFNQSGAYTIFLQIADSNGCIDTATRVASIIVYPAITPKFKTTYKISCPTTPVKFENLSDSSGKCISSWWWDYGDGSGDSSMSNWNTQFTHTYTQDGEFNPKLFIKSCYGCVDSFVFSAGARNIFYRFDIKKSTPGPLCWEGNKVCFEQKPRSNAYYWLWTFDDPPSQQLNTDDHTWKPCHKYTSPGIYHITLKIWEPNCVRDTTICAFIALKGPQAMIKLPAPAQNNKCQSGKKIPISAFEAAYTRCYNPTGNPIIYEVAHKVPKYAIRTDSFYCNATVLNTDTIYKPGCDDRTTITKINYRLGNAQGADIFYDSIFWYLNTWKPGDPYPWVSDPVNAKTVYYPPITSCNYKNIHDSDQYISTCSGPNLVFFPNNTIKYRLRYDIDNNAPYFTIPPGKDMSMDKCKNPSYPWGSDSLQYFWDFKDPYGDNCTSSVTTPNNNCKYSTERTPYHLYKHSGTFIAELTATDTVMGCISTAKVSIIMDKPDAGWDTSAFKKLDWATQLLNAHSTKRKGVILNGTPCVGQAYPQIPDFSGTLPHNDRQKWWMVFDSAAQCSGYCKDSVWVDTNGNVPPIKNKLIKTIAIQCGWIDDQTFAQMGNKWTYAKGGCKTIGLIIKTGDCYDTFWYNQYKYIADLQPVFDVLDPSSYNINTGRYMRTLDYAYNQTIKLCPPFQTILTVTDTQQTGLADFHFSISKNYSAPWTKSWKQPMEDSCKLIQSVSYLLCYMDSFTIDPFTGDTTYNNCFIFPNPNKNCGVNQSANYTLQYFLNQGYFKRATFHLLDLRDTLFINDTNGNSLFEPGKYAITTIVRNIYNCVNMAQRELIVGHYTDFTASEQVVCYEGGGDKVIFNGTIRYFQQKQMSWDPELNPTEYWRDPYGPRGGLGPAAPSIPEVVEWDLNGDGVYGDGATTKPDSVVWVYNQPGNYTVRMRTTDSNNCFQVLERKDFIRVIGVWADFDTANGVSVCAPQTIQFVDKSYGLNTYEYIYDRFDGIMDSILLDSVVSWKWDFGDNLGGNRSVSYLKNPIHTYRNNGYFNTSLIVKTSNGCTDTIIKQKYIHIWGPIAEFSVLDSIGYAPYTVYVKDKSDASTIITWEFIKGDNTIASFNKRPFDSVFSLTYNTPGIYYLYLRASDSVYNATAHRWIQCIAEYGEPSDSNDPHFKIVVYPTSIEEEVKSNEFFVYPNPFTESVNIFIPQNKAIAEIELLDLSGKSINIRKNIKGQNMEIFRDGLPRGMYILKIVSDKVSVYKIIAE